MMRGSKVVFTRPKFGELMSARFDLHVERVVFADVDLQLLRGAGLETTRTNRHGVSAEFELRNREHSLSVVLTVRDLLVALSVAVTSAPATAALFGSTTVPVNVPAVVWA